MQLNKSVLSLPKPHGIIFLSSKIKDKRDDFAFDIVNFPFWMVTFRVLPLTGLQLLNR